MSEAMQVNTELFLRGCGQCLHRAHLGDMCLPDHAGGHCEGQEGEDHAHDPH
jgi:hypothetical protein